MSNLKILIVEDESLIAMELAQTIKDMGYHDVSYVTSSTQAREIINQNSIDLLLLDIHLENQESGIELFSNLPYPIMGIYVTAYKDEKTIDQAIQTSPLGYLVKPIKECELKALLKLAESKKRKEATPIKLNQEYSFEPKSDKLFLHDKVVPLGKKELTLLKLLLFANENPISFKELEQSIWSETTISSSALRTLIYRLRGKLGHQFIETEFNYGVKLIKA